MAGFTSKQFGMAFAVVLGERRSSLLLTETRNPSSLVLALWIFETLLFTVVQNRCRRVRGRGAFGASTKLSSSSLCRMWQFALTATTFSSGTFWCESREKRF